MDQADKNIQPDTIVEATLYLSGYRPAKLGDMYYNQNGGFDTWMYETESLVPLHIYKVSSKTLGVHASVFTQVQEILDKEPASEQDAAKALNILDNLDRDHPGCAEVQYYSTLVHFLND